MLRVEIQDTENSLILALEGRFTDGAAENARTLITRCREGMRRVVDLTELTFVDSAGEEVLSFFGHFGAEFVAQHPMRSISVTASIFASLGRWHRMPTTQAPPA